MSASNEVAKLMVLKGGLKNMKINFKKVATIIGSALMLGSTVGLAAAAAYSAPFVQSGAANVAIVVGGNAASSDVFASSNIVADLATDLAAQTATSSSGSSASASGDAVNLAPSSTKIWLNTSMNTATTTLTKSDLPTVLGDYTFSGNVDSKLTSTIAVGSNKVTFAKQPSSNDDPVLGITIGSSSSAPLYTASITMPKINFTEADSEGETIKLFGRDFVVSTATDATNLVLFSSAKEVSLSAGAADSVTSTDVVIGNSTYTVALVTGTSSTATVSVNGESKEINEGSSKKVGGIDVAVKSVTESTALNTVTASLLVGSSKITFTNDTQVLVGSDDDPVAGTYVTFTGTPVSLTGLSVAVYAPSSSEDAILVGEAFTDPVFGSFKVDFSGLNIGLDSTARDTIKVDKSGDKGLQLTMTDSGDNAKTFDFVYNATNTTFLGDSNSYKIKVQEGANLSENAYTVVGNEDYGHLLQVTRIYNNTGPDYSKDAVTFKDVFDGSTYQMDPIAEGTGRLTVDGKQYTVAYGSSGDTGWATIKYPTSEASATQYVIFPTIQTAQGALVGLYEPQTVTLGNKTGLLFPNGDGYTTVATTYVGGNATYANWTIGGTAITSPTDYGTNYSTATYKANTVGKLTFNVNDTGYVNITTVSLVNPTTHAEIAAPGLFVFEAKNDSSSYNAITVQAELVAAGSSTDPLGVASVGFTGTSFSASLQSDSDITQYVDIWGTLVAEDSNTASQKVVTISYPKSQVYADIFVGALDSVVTQGGSNGGSATSIGSITVTDAEASSMTSKNLIVVGGSCINSVAAQLLGGAFCGADFTAKTGIAEGQAMIKSFPQGTDKVALLVAGYNAADTTKAVTYLINKGADTTVGAGVKVTAADTAVALVA